MLIRLIHFQNKCNDGLQAFDDDDDFFPPHANIPTSLPNVETSTSTTSQFLPTASLPASEETETTEAADDDVIEISEEHKFAAVEAVGATHL